MGEVLLDGQQVAANLDDGLGRLLGAFTDPLGLAAQGDGQGRPADRYS